VYLEINVTVLSNNFLEYFLEIEKLFIHSEFGYVRCSSLVFPTNAWPQLKSRQLGFCLQRKHEDCQFKPSKKMLNRLTDNLLG
jgi:hypothetical protein